MGDADVEARRTGPGGLELALMGVTGQTKVAVDLVGDDSVVTLTTGSAQSIVTFLGVSITGDIVPKTGDFVISGDDLLG